MPDFDPSDTVDFLDTVLKQDFDICYEVQKGIKSRAHKVGVYSPSEFLPNEFNEGGESESGALVFRIVDNAAKNPDGAASKL